MNYIKVKRTATLESSNAITLPRRQAQHLAEGATDVAHRSALDLQKRQQQI